MLGIRLSTEAEKQLERHARALGRGKSVIAREWIMQRLERESVDAQVRRVAEHLAKVERGHDRGDDAGDSILDWLDQEDGGYDWGPDGPPSPL